MAHTIVKQRWINDDMYVRIDYVPSTGHMDVFLFERDPRKAQHRKPKFWSRNSSHGFAAGMLDHFKNGLRSTIRWESTAVKMLEEDFSLTSSIGRALVS